MHRDWGDEWLAGKRGSTAKSSLSTYSRCMTGFLAFIGPLADMPMERLDESHFRGYRDDLRKKNRTARTCNQALKILRGWMKTAVVQGHLARNPGASVPMLLETDSIERAPYEAKELERLLKTADGSWKGVVMLGGGDVPPLGIVVIEGRDVLGRGIFGAFFGGHLGGKS
jgi:site-specific recombinase XerD